MTPLDLVPGWDDPDNHDAPLMALIRDRALDVQYEMIPPASDSPKSRTDFTVSSAARDVAAVVLHRLAAHLPDVTDAQRQFLVDTARELAPEVVDEDTQASTDEGANRD